MLMASSFDSFLGDVIIGLGAIKMCMMSLLSAFETLAFTKGLRLPMKLPTLILCMPWFFVEGALNIFLITHARQI